MVNKINDLLSVASADPVKSVVICVVLVICIDLLLFVLFCSY